MHDLQMFGVSDQHWVIEPAVLLLGQPGDTNEELVARLRGQGVRVLASRPLAGIEPWRDGPLLDLAIVDGAGLTGGALAELLEAILPDLADADVPVIVLLELHQLDDAAPWVIGAGGQALCAPSAEELRLAVARALDRSTALLHDSRSVRTPDLHYVQAEVERIAATLRDMVVPPALPGQPPTLPVLDASSVRGLIRARRARDRFFAAKLFADPAWDILLDLYAAHLERGEVSVSSLCYASATPPTTGLRWIALMTDAGLLERVADPRDKRRQIICLTAPAIAAMDAYFACVLNAKDKRLVI